MAKKIFISYKHSDNSVYPLSNTWSLHPATARDYVNMIESHFKNTGDHIYIRVRGAMKALQNSKEIPLGVD